MTRLVSPLHLLAALAIVVALLVSAFQGIRDPDLWWHTWIGAEILERRTVTGLGNTWAPFGDSAWTTTQWLPEIVYFALLDAFGWDAIPALRLIANALTLVGAAWLLLPGRPARVAVPLYLLVLLGLLPFLIQDRPQTLALCLAPLLASMTATWLQTKHAPQWWAVLLLTLVWANLHGSWIVVPAVLGLVVLGHLVAGEPPRTTLTAGVRLLTVSVLAGLATPATWHSIKAIIRFPGRTDLLTEWQPTTPAALYALPLAALIGLLAWSWARSGPVPRAEIVFSVGVISFGMLANRNIPYALIMLAPLVVDRLARWARPAPTVRPGEARVLSALVVAVVAVGVAAATVVLRSTDADTRAAPTRIAAALGGAAEPVRVLNSYETAGVLLAFSDGNVELGIDGRADRYPLAYSTAYLAAVRDLVDWPDLVAAVDPDVAVLRADEALATQLQQIGWHLDMRDSAYVLLRPGEAS